VICQNNSSLPGLSRRLSEIFAVVFCTLMIATAGCKKEKAPSSDVGTSNEGTAPALVTSESKSVAAGPVVLPAVSPQNNNSDAALAELSLALRRYVVQTKRAPKTFEEFIAQTQIQPPPPPAGQKYVIKSGAVVLEKQ
jgi:hypothetical protein